MREFGCCGSNRILLDSQLLESVDPHGLAPWVNEIGRLHRTSEAIADPHELASWVNEIAGYTGLPKRLQTPMSLPRG